MAHGSGSPTAVPLVFDHRYTAALPGDPSDDPRPRQVAGAAFSRVDPTPVVSPRTLAVSTEVATLLGIDRTEAEDFAQVFAGNRVPQGADPHAMAYGGHQFGTWAGQLGDGRAISYGEVRDRNGQHQTLQLKGAGPTPYSRRGDGRAVLRSSIREFLCSEAMAALGVPTTRALSLVATGEEVVRDMLYDGHPRPEPGAVVCRVAPSFIRFGHFELPAARGDLDLLGRLTDFTITQYFPGHHRDRLDEWFAEVGRRSIAVSLDWLRVGFVHGVLNTDNMSILGLTIDYGPYGWLEPYDPRWTPNTTDAATRRYRFEAQPQIVFWNLIRLANALVPLIGDPEPFEAVLDDLRRSYAPAFAAMMTHRLGWGDPRPGDDEQIETLIELLERAQMDYVMFFRSLAEVAEVIEVAEVDDVAEIDDDALFAPIAPACYLDDGLPAAIRTDLIAWLRAWTTRAERSGLDPARRRHEMRAANPRYVLRNYLAAEVIDAAEAGDLEPLHTLAAVLRHPYDDQPGSERFAQRRPSWAADRAGCSVLSCSS